MTLNKRQRAARLQTVQNEADKFHALLTAREPIRGFIGTFRRSLALLVKLARKAGYTVRKNKNGSYTFSA